MKILMATMGLDIGGAETHIVELSKELKRQGHDVAIISNGGAPKDCNLFQSVKGLHNGLFAMNDGSSVVLCVLSGH